jgi:hypothetical protein
MHQAAKDGAGEAARRAHVRRVGDFLSTVLNHDLPREVADHVLAGTYEAVGDENLYAPGNRMVHLREPDIGASQAELVAAAVALELAAGYDGLGQTTLVANDFDAAAALLVARPGMFVAPAEREEDHADLRARPTVTLQRGYGRTAQVLDLPKEAEDVLEKLTAACLLGDDDHGRAWPRARRAACAEETRKQCIPLIGLLFHVVAITGSDFVPPARAVAPGALQLNYAEVVSAFLAMLRRVVGARGVEALDEGGLLHMPRGRGWTADDQRGLSVEQRKIAQAEHPSSMAREQTLTFQIALTVAIALARQLVNGVKRQVKRATDAARTALNDEERRVAHEILRRLRCQDTPTAFLRRCHPAGTGCWGPSANFVVCDEAPLAFFVPKRTAPGSRTRAPLVVDPDRLYAATFRPATRKSSALEHPGPLAEKRCTKVRRIHFRLSGGMRIPTLLDAVRRVSAGVVEQGYAKPIPGDNPKALCDDEINREVDFWRGQVRSSRLARAPCSRHDRRRYCGGWARRAPSAALGTRRTTTSRGRWSGLVSSRTCPRAPTATRRTPMATRPSTRWRGQRRCQLPRTPSTLRSA